MRSSSKIHSLRALCVCLTALGLSACVGVESSVEVPPAEQVAGESMASEGLTAEDPESVDSSEPAADDLVMIPAEGMTEASLGNIEYDLDGQSVTLVDGSYAEKPDPDAATFITKVSMGPWQAFGDLNGDGVEDAAVILIDAPGGSGVFTFLAAVVDEGGLPVNAATASLGDRPQIDSVSIEDGRILISGKTHAESDPMCCPSLAFRWSFSLEDGSLSKTELEVESAEQ
jgi:hypothetical protein